MKRNKSVEVFKRLVSDMLSKYGVDYDYVYAHPTIDGQAWYVYYTWTKAEEDVFREHFIDVMRKELRMNKYSAEKEWGWFNICWGLRTEEEMRNPFYFEEYCAPCIFFNDGKCDKGKDVTEDTKWKDIGCTDFWD